MICNKKGPTYGYIMGLVMTLMTHNTPWIRTTDTLTTAFFFCEQSELV